MKQPRSRSSNPPKPPRRIKIVGRILKRGAPPVTVLVGYTPNKLPPNLIVQKRIADPMVEAAVALGGIAIKWEGYTAEEVIRGSFIYHEMEDDQRLHMRRVKFSVTENRFDIRKQNAT